MYAAVTNAVAALYSWLLLHQKKNTRSSMVLYRILKAFPYKVFIIFSKTMPLNILITSNL